MLWSQIDKSKGFYMLAVTQEINSNMLGSKSQTREVGEKIVQKVLCKITFQSFAKGTTE